MSSFFRRALEASTSGVSSRRASRRALVLIVLAIVGVLAQAISLVGRARHGNTDFYIIYRCVVALRDGAGAELYAHPDPQTLWQRTLPPGALMFFQPLASLNPVAAGVVWALANGVLLVACVWALHRITSRLERQRRLYRSVLPWMTIVLLLLAQGSIQVGQVSLLFAACWIFYLSAVAEHRKTAGAWLALPCVMKIYPLLLLGAPLSLVRRRDVLACLAGVALLGFALPFAVYGARAGELNASYFRHVLVGSRGRMKTIQAVHSPNEQGIESVLQRYLTANPNAPKRLRVPHLDLNRALVLRLVQMIRIAILLVTVFVVSQWRRRVRERLRPNANNELKPRKQDALFATLQMAALWSATLYLILPGAKSRYAVYAFLAFCPLLVMAAGAKRLRRASGRSRAGVLSAITAFCLVTVLLAIPKSLRIVGVGLVGSSVLWIVNLRGVARLDRSRAT